MFGVVLSILMKNTHIFFFEQSYKNYNNSISISDFNIILIFNSRSRICGRKYLMEKLKVFHKETIAFKYKNIDNI